MPDALMVDSKIRRPWRKRARGWQGAIGLVLLCLTVYVPGFFTIPPVDRDESRFAQASRQMFESVALPADAQDAELHDGGLLIPKVQDRLRLNKPPLIYWLQAASAAVLTGGDPLRDSIWMYRVPSLLAGLVIVLATWRIGASMHGPRVGWLAGAMIAVAPVFVWEAHQARADMVLVAWTTLAMGVMWKVWKEEGTKARRHEGTKGGRERRRDEETKRKTGRWRWFSACAFWVLIGLGIMTKGPVTPLVAGLGALTLCVVTRRWRWLWSLKPIVGVVIVLAMVLPWVLAVSAQVGWDVYWSTIYEEVIGRSGGAKEGHWGPPGYHLLLMPVLLWPGSMLVGLAIPFAFRRALTRRSSTGGANSTRRRRPGHRADLYLLAWIVPAWIVFELVMTKLPHYTMPLYPALAILCARAVFAAARCALPGLRHWLARTGLIGWGLLSIAISMLPMLPLLVGGVRPLGPSSFYRTSGGIAQLAAYVGIALAFIIVIQCIRRLVQGRYFKAQRTALVAAVVVLATTLGLALPHAHRLWISPRIVTFLPIDEEPRVPLASVGFHEDSLVFLTRGRLDRIDRSDIDAWAGANPGGVLIVREEELVPMRAFLGDVEGLNYSNGKREHIVIGTGVLRD